jgi:hypothetical protein
LTQLEHPLESSSEVHAFEKEISIVNAKVATHQQSVEALDHPSLSLIPRLSGEGSLL